MRGIHIQSVFAKAAFLLLAVMLASAPLQYLLAAQNNCMQKTQMQQKMSKQHHASVSVNADSQDLQHDCCKQDTCKTFHCSSFSSACFSNMLDNQTAFHAESIVAQPVVFLPGLTSSPLYRPPIV